MTQTTAAPTAPEGPPLPPAPPIPPTYADVPYGPHERNVLDFWRATRAVGGGKTPPLLFIHGGGFRNGDKRAIVARNAGLFRQCLASPINHVALGAPPVYLTYSQPNVPPTPDLPSGPGIHHPRFGEVLKEKLDQLGVECIVRCKGDPEEPPTELDFLRKHSRLEAYR